MATTRAPRRLGELEREERHTARALGHHPVARLDLRFHHQRAPCRERRAGERRGLGARPASGRTGEPCRGRCRIIARIALRISVAGDDAGISGPNLAIGPVREEQADGLVTHREVRDALADRFHDAGAVRHGCHAVLRAKPAGDDGIVMIIERGSLDPDEDFARAWWLRRLARERERPDPVDRAETQDTAERGHYLPPSCERKVSSGGAASSRLNTARCDSVALLLMWKSSASRPV